jgi:hypothetical protein
MTHTNKNAFAQIDELLVGGIVESKDIGSGDAFGQQVSHKLAQQRWYVTGRSYRDSKHSIRLLYHRTASQSITINQSNQSPPLGIDDHDSTLLVKS